MKSALFDLMICAALLAEDPARSKAAPNREAVRRQLGGVSGAVL